MSVRRLATAAAFCVLAAPLASAQTATPLPSAGTGQQPTARLAPGWPRILPNKPSSEPTFQSSATWSRHEIELAQARCTAILRGLDVVAVPEAPIRESGECGTPAPMKLVSIGKSPEVALSPPPTLTCDLIAALARWMERDVQPLARKHLGAPVIRIEAMSSYSCRNAYGRAKSRLSEHGRANALDIGAFVTARGQTAAVVAHWGPTAREIADRLAAAGAASERAEADTAAAPSKPDRPASAVQAADQPAVRLPQITITVPGVAVQMPDAAPDRAPDRAPERATGLGLGQASRLGGPKPAGNAVAPASPAAPDSKATFLRAVHRSACKTFATVLGPEANTAHQNHFHVDLAERTPVTSICE